MGGGWVRSLPNVRLDVDAEKALYCSTSCGAKRFSQPIPIEFDTVDGRDLLSEAFSFRWW